MTLKCFKRQLRKFKGFDNIYTKILFHILKGNEMIAAQDGKHSNHGIKHQFSYQDNRQHSQNDELNPIYFHMSSCITNTFKCEGQNNEITFIQYFKVKFPSLMCPSGLICDFSKKTTRQVKFIMPYFPLFHFSFCFSFQITQNLLQGKQGNSRRQRWQCQGESDYRSLSYYQGLKTKDSASILNSLKADSGIR